MRRVMVLGALAVLLFMSAGCETIKGVGRDITKAGEAIEDATR